MKNKKLVLVVIAIVLIIAVVCIVTKVVSTNKDGGTTVKASIDEEVWLTSGDVLTITDTDDTITLTISSDLTTFDKTVDGYLYEVDFVLNINGTDYSGTHTFAPSYSIHSMDNDAVYDVEFLDFDVDTVQVKMVSK